jgi:hypothetical protein
LTLIDALSRARLATYRTWANGDETLALRLYAYNSRLSASLYDPLHMLEVTLRNTIDRHFQVAYGPDWLIAGRAGLTVYQQDNITKAQQALSRQGKIITHDPLVAELNFGFWVSLFSSQSNAKWQYLRPMFAAPKLKRADIAGRLDAMRTLRNRIAHHEPILRLPLDARYTTIRELVSWMEPDAATWIDKTSTWPSIFLGAPTLIVDPATQDHRVVAAIITALPALP